MEITACICTAAIDTPVLKRKPCMTRQPALDHSHDAEFGVPYRTAQAILAHPDFAQARRLYLESLLALYGEDAFLNKLLLEGARQVVFGALICLLAAHNMADRSTWPTLADLKRVLKPFGQSSDRKIEQLVARLGSVGFIEQNAVPGDARVRLLTPSSAMLAHDEAWLLAHYRPLALLYPQDDHSRPLARDRAFQLAQRRIAFAFIPRSATVLLGNPAILLFATRDAGFLVLAQLVLDSEDGRSTSFEGLSRRFAISRTHVRQMLRDAQAMGLLTLSGRGGQAFTLLPAMWAALDKFVAEGMSGHDLTGAAARAALELSSPPEG